MSDRDEIEVLRSKIRALNAQMESIIREVGGLRGRVTPHPEVSVDAPVVVTALDPSLTNESVLTVAPNSGLSTSFTPGNAQITFNPNNITDAGLGALRILFGGTNATNATQAAMNFALTQIISTDNMSLPGNTSAVINRSITINSGKKLTIASGARMRIL